MLRDRETKEKWVKQKESGIAVTTKKRCFNCNETGHHHTQCVNPPFCYNCKKMGHKAHDCLDKIELKNCGFGMPGMGFYSIHIPISEQSDNNGEVTGLMTVLEGEADERRIEIELLHQFRGSTQWNITRLSEKEFLIDFPNDDLRYQLTKFKSFEFLTGPAEMGVKVKVENTDASPDPSSILEKVWVKAFGFPQIAIKEEIIKKVAHLIGDPIEVDPISLIRMGPVRVRVACRNADLIRGENQVFFNYEGKMIKWVVEQKNPPKQPPPHCSKFDRFRKEEEDDDNEDTSQDSHNSKMIKVDTKQSGLMVPKTTCKQGHGSAKHIQAWMDQEKDGGRQIWKILSKWIMKHHPARTLWNLKSGKRVNLSTMRWGPKWSIENHKR